MKNINNYALEDSNGSVLSRISNSINNHLSNTWVGFVNFLYRKQVYKVPSIRPTEIKLYIDYFANMQRILSAMDTGFSYTTLKSKKNSDKYINNIITRMNALRDGPLEPIQVVLNKDKIHLNHPLEISSIIPEIVHRKMKNDSKNGWSPQFLEKTKTEIVKDIKTMIKTSSSIVGKINSLSYDQYEESKSIQRTISVVSSALDVFTMIIIKTKETMKQVHLTQ